MAKRAFEFTWQSTRDFMYEKRYNPYIPQGAEIMPLHWEPKVDSKEFEFLDHIEFTHIAYLDYPYESCKGETAKHLIRVPADSRDSTATDMAHVIGSAVFWTGHRGQGWSHQDYWGEWDCQSNYWIPSKRIKLLACKKDKHDPVFFVCPDDAVLVLDKIKDDKMGQYILDNMRMGNGNRAPVLFAECGRKAALADLLGISKEEAKQIYNEVKNRKDKRDKGCQG